MVSQPCVATTYTETVTAFFLSVQQRSLVNKILTFWAKKPTNYYLLEDQNFFLEDQTTQLSLGILIKENVRWFVRDIDKNICLFVSFLSSFIRL